MPLNKNKFESLLSNWNRNEQNATVNEVYYLSILEIDAEEYKNCKIDEKLKKIKKSRDNLLREIHPDKNQGEDCINLANDCVAKINEAYEGLKKQCAANLDHSQPIALDSVRMQRVESLQRQAQEKYIQGSYYNTISCCNEALLLNPQLLAAYRLRGLAYLHQGDLNSANIDCNNILTLGPENPNALQLRGEIKKRQGDNEGAKEDFRQALKKNGLSAGWKNTINGAIAYLNNNFREANDLLVSVYNTTARTDFFVLIYLGLSKQANGDYRSAVEIFNDLIKLYPNMQYAYILHEGALKKQQEREERDSISLAQLKNQLDINRGQETISEISNVNEENKKIILKELYENREGLLKAELLQKVSKTPDKSKLSLLEELERLGCIESNDKQRNYLSLYKITREGIKLYALLSKKTPHNISAEQDAVEKRFRETDFSIMEKKRKKTDQSPNLTLFASTTNAKAVPNFEGFVDKNSNAINPMAGQDPGNMPQPAQRRKSPSSYKRLTHAEWAKKRAEYSASSQQGTYEGERLEQMPVNKKS